MFIFRSRDWNRSFHQDLGLNEFIEAQSKLGRRVVVVEGELSAKRLKEYAALLGNQKIQYGYFGAHGNPYAMIFDDKTIFGWNMVKEMKDAGFDRFFDKDCELFIDSCQSGLGGNSVKDTVAHLFRALVPQAKPRGIWTRTVVGSGFRPAVENDSVKDVNMGVKPWEIFRASLGSIKVQDRPIRTTLLSWALDRRSHKLLDSEAASNN